MFALVRTIIYVSLLVSAVLLYVPGSEWFGSALARPETPGAQQVAGMVIGTAGVVLALACALLFAMVGKGTPLPFDPPRRLVTGGPYRVVRNPMAVGVGTALGSVALYYESLPMLWITVGFFLVIHLFVVLYEEPTLGETFGKDYETYCERVGRWWPILTKK